MYPQSLNCRVPRLPLASTTTREYLRICERLARDPRPLPDIPTSKNYARTIRAAVSHALRCLRGQVPADDQQAQAFAKCALARGGIAKLVEELAELDTAQLKARRGRVSRLRQLQVGWLQQFLAAASAEAPLSEAALLTVVLCGCRPCELRGTGFAARDDWFVVSVPTAKTGGGALRQLVWHENQWTRRLAHLIDLQEGSSEWSRPFSQMGPAHVAYLFAKTSRRALGSSSPGINASTMRNLLASMLKWRGWHPEEIARALGHGSVQTQKFYGRYHLAARAAGWQWPAAVVSAQPVKLVSTLASLRQSIAVAPRSREGQAR